MTRLSYEEMLERNKVLGDQLVFELGKWAGTHQISGPAYQEMLAIVVNYGVALVDLAAKGLIDRPAGN